MSYPLYKFVGSLTEPVNLFAVFLCLSGLLLLLPWERGQRIGKRGCVALAAFLLALTVLPLGQWALLPLENAYAVRGDPDKVDGIVMLTGDESPSLSKARGMPISRSAAQRHITVARLARRYPKARIVVTGNTEPFFPPDKMTTKDVIQEEMDAMGVPRGRVEYETRSRTTHENALFTKALVKPKEGQTWLLLTSASHMMRAALCFEKQGWKIVPTPTDYLTRPGLGRPHGLDLARQVLFLNRAAHEYVGLLSYWASGWIERPWK